MAGPIGAPAQFDVAAALEHAVEDRLGEIRIVQDPAPRGERLVRGEDHRPPVQVAVVDDLEEHVGRVRPVAEIAHLIDHQHVRMRVGRQRMPQAAPAGGERQVGDQRRRRGEDGVEAVLDGAVGDGDGQVRLAGAARPAEEQRVAAVTNSGLNALPRSERRTADWKVKSYSSMVLRNGKWARRTQRWMRVCARCATSSAMRMAR